MFVLNWGGFSGYCVCFVYLLVTRPRVLGIRYRNRKEKGDFS